MRPPLGAAASAGGSNDVFCGLKSGPRRTLKCSCFFCSPFKLIVIVSVHEYDARACLFFADDSLTAATRCCSSGFCATANPVKYPVVNSTNENSKVVRESFRSVVFIFITMAGQGA